MSKHPLTQIKWGIVPVTMYRGVLVSRIIGGYKWRDQKFLTEQQLDDAITKSEKSLQQSITNVNQ